MYCTLRGVGLHTGLVSVVGSVSVLAFGSSHVQISKCFFYQCLSRFKIMKNLHINKYLNKVF